MDLFKDVKEFHEKFGDPVTTDGQPPHLICADRASFRLNFLDEELTETEEGMATSDLAKIADGLADLVWVALGTAHWYGIPFNAVWAEVKRANMSKVRSTGDDDPLSVRQSKFDIVKPPGFVPPDVEGVLRRHGWFSPVQEC